jgi:glycosyltransferase involved in cell wall biosynthesis
MSGRHVLLFAFTAEPGRGSEPGAGWNLIRAAARNNDVTAIVRADEHDKIRRGLAQEATQRVRLIPVQVPFSKGPSGGAPLYYARYLAWHLKAGLIGRKLEDEVDVAHHATFATDWVPSGAHLLRNTPVIWGPVGGYARFPKKLLRYLGVRGLLRELARGLLTGIARRLTVLAVRNRTSLTVCCNGDVAKALRSMQPQAIEPPVAIAGDFAAVERSTVGESEPSAREGRRRVLFIGRLQAWKGTALALSALQHLPANWTLEVFGDGPDRGRMEAASARDGLLRRVAFRGHAPRSEVADGLSRADALLFPSMHDAGGFAVAEAVTVGCPVVCLDVGGPPTLIAGENGVAVPPTAEAPRLLAEALLKSSRGPGSDRWRADRLVALVDQWYEEVTAR